jgi:hypothetical protein
MNPKDLEMFVEELKKKIIVDMNELYQSLQKQKLMYNENLKKLELIGMYGPEHTIEIAIRDIKSVRIISLNKLENTNIMNIQHSFKNGSETWGTLIFTTKGNVYDNIENLVSSEEKAFDFSMNNAAQRNDGASSKVRNHKIFDNPSMGIDQLLPSK